MLELHSSITDMTPCRLQAISFGRVVFELPHAANHVSSFHDSTLIKYLSGTFSPYVYRQNTVFEDVPPTDTPVN